MSPGVWDGPPGLGFDTLGAAIGLDVVAGLLACLEPAFVSLAGALAALAVAAWARGLPPHAWSPTDPRRAGRGTALVVAAVAGGWYLHPLPGLAVSRGILLGAGLVPLWWVERRRGVRPRSGAAIG